MNNLECGDLYQTITLLSYLWLSIIVREIELFDSFSVS